MAALCGAIFLASPLTGINSLIIVLIVNPLVFHLNPFIAGWMLVVEFIFTLAMALGVIRFCREACWRLRR